MLVGCLVPRAWCRVRVPGAWCLVPRAWCLVLVLVLVLVPGASAQPANPRALVEFQRAADAYAFVHRSVERKLGLAHRRAGEPEDVQAAELAAALVAERAAVEGRIFMPAAVAVLRDLLARVTALPGCDAGDLKSGGASPVQVNGPAASTRPLNACIADVLPRLPDELAYRSAGADLVIIDTHAGLVVDVLRSPLA
jgi:hypothetical protein